MAMKSRYTNKGRVVKKTQKTATRRNRLKDRGNPRISVRYC